MPLPEDYPLFSSRKRSRITIRTSLLTNHQFTDYQCTAYQCTNYQYTCIGRFCQAPLVEMRGFEPLTSSVQGRRSPI